MFVDTSDIVRKSLTTSDHIQLNQLRKVTHSFLSMQEKCPCFYFLQIIYNLNVTRI